MLDQVLSGRIELLVNVLQSFRSDRLHSHQRAFDIGGTHGIEEFGIFRRLHRYLGEENHVGRKLRQARH